MVQIKICIGSCCHLRGAEKVVEKFQNLIHREQLEKKVELQGSFCMGNCSDSGVVLSVNSRQEEILPDQAESFFLKSVMPLVS